MPKISDSSNDFNKFIIYTDALKYFDRKQTGFYNHVYYYKNDRFTLECYDPPFTLVFIDEKLHSELGYKSNLNLNSALDALHEFLDIIDGELGVTMTIDEYQKWTDKTATYPDAGKGNYVYPALGLAGECGECCEKIKKIIRDKGGIVTDEFKKEITKELGDVYWYLARLAKEFGLKSGDIIKANVNKLEDRLKRNKIHGEGDNR